MEKKLINSLVSIFGNFTEVVRDSQKINKVYEGFKVEEGSETLPNGISAKAYTIGLGDDSKGSKRIVLRSTRIDVQFGYFDEGTLEDFLTYAYGELEKIFTNFNIAGSRIAYNSVGFFDNTDGVVVKKLNELFNVNNIFGSSAQEFQMRLNHVKTISNEDFNAVLLVQDGSVVNNKTKQRMNVVFSNADINSIITNANPRFKLEETKSYLADLVALSQEREQIIFSKID